MPISLALGAKLKNRGFRLRVIQYGLQDTIAVAVRDLREERGLTQKQLAKRCGMQQSQISRIESGDAGVTIKTLVRIADAMNAEWRLGLTAESDRKS